MYTKTILAVLLASGLAGVAAANPSADGILKAVRDREDGRDSYSESRLILDEPGGSKRERDLIYLQKDYNDDERLTLYFKGPTDVKGVGFQSANYRETAGKDDEQWLYLPAFKQVRRIATGDKRGSFMGSEYAYIDLDKLRVGDYRQTLKGSETVDGRDCWVIERIPASEEVITKTGYHKSVVWVDKERNVILKQTYYNSADVLFKVMNVTRIEQVQGIWTVMESVMTDRVSGKRSTLQFRNVRYDVGLDDKLFQQRVLQSGVNAGNLPTFN
jgi:outer membrane lipoprotein-sorting protein